MFRSGSCRFQIQPNRVTVLCMERGVLPFSWLPWPSPASPPPAKGTVRSVWLPTSAGQGLAVGEWDKHGWRHRYRACFLVTASLDETLKRAWRRSSAESPVASGREVESRGAYLLFLSFCPS